MTWLVRRAARRFYLRHPWQLALAIAGVALGVAVYVGVDLANDSARRAFDLSAAVVTGRTTHRLLPVGGPLPDDAYRTLVLEHDVALAAPVVETGVALPGRSELNYPLLGVDPLSETGLRGFSGLVPGDTSSLARLIAEPGTVLVPEALAERAGVAVGAPLTLAVRGGRLVEVEVVGILDSDAAGAGDAEPPIVTDIATAQEIVGRIGTISRIDLRLDGDAAARLAAALPAGTTLVPVETENASFAQLANAFRTNLRALGLLALVVGMFLIYGTMSFAIVQRRATFGVLRSMGLARRELIASVLLEALALGAVATLVGIVLGRLLANGLVDLVLDTIGDFSYGAAVSAVEPSPWIYVKGGVLGVGATLAAALVPAFEAARGAPAAVLRRAQLERRAHRNARVLALAAVPVLAAAAVLIGTTSRELLPGFGGLFCVLVAGAMLTPAATVLLMKACERPAGRALGIAGLLAVRGVSGSLSRTGVAVAALSVAVATVMGVGLMIGSFRASLVEWLGTTLTADLYLGFDESAELGAAEVAALRRIDGVAGLTLSRTVQLPTDAGEVIVRAIEPGPAGYGLELVAGTPADAFDSLAAGDAVLIAEPFAFARELAVGEELVLPSGSGPAHLRVAGIYRDYNAGGGSLVMGLARYRSLYDDERLSGVGVQVADGHDVAKIERAVRSALAEQGGLRVRSSALLERISLEVFDRTFKITEVLRVLAGIVAFLGVLSALLSIELERAREIAVLRALGFVPRELTATLLVQTGLLGAAAGIAAMPLGMVLAALLVHVINRRSFGWTMDFVVTAGPLVSGLALAVGAALLAGLYPAYRAGRAQLGGALREE